MKKTIVNIINEIAPAFLCQDDAAQWVSNPAIWNPLDLQTSGPCIQEAHRSGACHCGKFRDLTPDQKAAFLAEYRGPDKYL